MPSIDQEKIQRTLEKVKARKTNFAKRQAEKEIENVSPAAIQAVRDLDELNANQGGHRDFMVMVDEYQVAHKCRKIDAIGAVSRMHPEAHEAYIRKVNA